MDQRSIAAFLMLALGAAHAERGWPLIADSSAFQVPAVDLDLSLGFEDEPAPMTADLPQPRTTWYYWAAAGTAIAAGGVGFYWYEDRAKAAGKVVRNEEVFTDEQ
jgi:hypothetical protein